MTKNKAVEQPSKKIEFLQNHLPVLKAGKYTIRVTQHLEAPEFILPQFAFYRQPALAQTFPEALKTFEVSGPRFSLTPDDIYSVFPPVGSLGDHSNVLPHIIFNQSTLPWERSLDGQSKTAPWLALLVFHEAEAPKAQAPITLAQLKPTTTSWHPPFEYQRGQLSTDKVNVIDVDQAILQHILPTQNDLEFLAHARQGLDMAGKAMGNEQAVLIANRLPQKGGITTVHLVSLENHFGVAILAQNHANKLNAGQLPNAIKRQFTQNKITLSAQFQIHTITPSQSWYLLDQDSQQKYQLWVTTVNQKEYINLSIFRFNEAGNKKIRLVSLKNWKFSCTSHEKSFKGILENLNRTPALLRLPSIQNNNATKPYLVAGRSPHLHFFRQGSQSVSWYHGPLSVADHNKLSLKLPVFTADELLRYYVDSGMFEVSYAAAWELGRMLSLQDKSFSTALYKWKRQHAQLVQAAERRLSHLPKHQSIIETARAFSLPSIISDWFEKTSLLEGVPFNYLVPDEKMLPQESLRFFKLDRFWVECLLDGAFSIGRVSKSQMNKDRKHHAEDEEDYPEQPAGLPFDQISGFILRSEMVSGWPGLLIDAMEDHLLELPDSFQNDLNKNKLSLHFRKAFAINNQPLLSTGAGEVEVVLEDTKTGVERWKIMDLAKEEQYYVHHQGNKLLVSLKNKLLRKAQLSPEVMLCLFEGEIRTLDFHLQAESLHFGLDFPGPGNNAFHKKLKGDDGSANGIEIDTIPMRTDAPQVINIAALTQSLQDKLAKSTFTSAQFALEMTEGVERVRFEIRPAST